MLSISYKKRKKLRLIHGRDVCEKRLLRNYCMFVTLVSFCVYLTKFRLKIDMKRKAFTKFFLVQKGKIIYSFLLFYDTQGLFFHVWFLVLLVSTFLWIFKFQIMPSNSFYHVTKNQFEQFAEEYDFWSIHLFSTSIVENTVKRNCYICWMLCLILIGPSKL